MADLKQHVQNQIGITPLYLSKLLYPAEQRLVPHPPISFPQARQGQEVL